MPATNPLDELARERVRYHLGYPTTGPSAPSIQLGIAKPAQTLFLVEQSMDLLSDTACDRVRELIAKLECTEKAIFGKQGELSAASFGSVTLRGSKKGERITDMLEAEYTRWAQRLADALGVPMYLYAKRFSGAKTGAVPVRH